MTKNMRFRRLKTREPTVYECLIQQAGVPLSWLSAKIFHLPPLLFISLIYLHSQKQHVGLKKQSIGRWILSRVIKHTGDAEGAGGAQLM